MPPKLSRQEQMALDQTADGDRILTLPDALRARVMKRVGIATAMAALDTMPEDAKKLLGWRISKQTVAALLIQEELHIYRRIVVEAAKQGFNLNELQLIAYNDAGDARFRRFEEVPDAIREDRDDPTGEGVEQA